MTTRYRVRFLYNGRGLSTVDHIVECELPEHWGIADIAAGFWVRVDGPPYLTGRISPVPGDPLDMWVPPGRVTAVVKQHTG